MKIKKIITEERIPPQTIEEKMEVLKNKINEIIESVNKRGKLKIEKK